MKENGRVFFKELKRPTSKQVTYESKLVVVVVFFYPMKVLKTVAATFWTTDHDQRPDYDNEMSTRK